MADGQAADGRLDRASIAGIAVVALLAVLQLPTPVHGDQALAIVFGRAILDGAGMFGDTGTWDFRPPGIFLLHAASTALPGDDVVGARVLEGIWWVGTAAFASKVLGSGLRTPLGRLALPLLVGGVHLAVASPRELGQPESFLGLPLLVACWSGLPDATPSTRRRIAGGVALGLVALLKHPFVLVPLLVWFLAGRPRPRVADVVRRVAPIVGVGLLVVGAVVLWLAIRGDLGDAAWTLFVYGPSTPGMDGRPLRRLLDMGVAAVLLFGPAALVALHRLVVRRRSLEVLDRALLVWLVAGGALLLPQHWWPYLPVVLVVPVCVLAARAVDALAADRRRAGLAALVVVLALPLARLGARGLDLLDHGLGLSADDRRELALADRPAVGDAAAWVATLGPDDAAFAFGDPVAMLLADRPYAASIHGWSPEFLDADLWARLTRQLAESRPERIAVDGFARGYAEQRDPAFLAFLDEGWCPDGGTDGVTWYVRRDLATCD